MICSRRRATKRMRLRSEDRSLSIDPMHFFPQRSLALCCWVHTRNTTAPLHHTLKKPHWNCAPPSPKELVLLINQPSLPTLVCHSTRGIGLALSRSSHFGRE